MIELPVVNEQKTQATRKPKWLRVKLPVGKEYLKVRELVDQYKLHTICESGNCPNMGGVLGSRHCDFHDPWQCLHKVVQFLCSSYRQASRV
jgi:lipoic acid synthetase